MLKKCAMAKKAQITLFVIIAILIVAGVLAALYAPRLLQNLNAPSNDQAKSAESAIDSCVETSSENALKVISNQGGYIMPSTYLEDGVYEMGYWYENSSDVSPELKTIELELSDAVCIILKNCIQLDNYTINYTKGDCNAVSQIRADYILIDINYPITIFADKTYLFSKFSTKLDARLGKGFIIAKKLIAEQASHPDLVCLTCAADVAAENNMLINIGSRGESLLVNIIDNQSKVYTNQSYEFHFAMDMAR